MLHRTSVPWWSWATSTTPPRQRHHATDLRHQRHCLRPDGPRCGTVQCVRPARRFRIGKDVAYSHIHQGAPYVLDQIRSARSSCPTGATAWVMCAGWIISTTTCMKDATARARPRLCARPVAAEAAQSASDSRAHPLRPLTPLHPATSLADHRDSPSRHAFATGCTLTRRGGCAQVTSTYKAPYSPHVRGSLWQPTP